MQSASCWAAFKIGKHTIYMIFTWHLHDTLWCRCDTHVTSSCYTYTTVLTMVFECIGGLVKFHFKKYGASHLRLNQTMSPIPRRLRPEPQTQNHIPNRSKSALSSSLSRSTPHLAQTLPARGSVSSSPSPNRRQSTTRTIQRPDNSDLDYRGPSRRSTPGGLKSAKSTSNLSRLSSSENSRKPYDSTRRRLKLKQSNDVRIRLS